MKIKSLLKPLIKITMYCFRIFPIDENKITFSAFSARAYGDNPKYIAQYLNNQSKTKYNLVFILDNPKKYKVPDGIKTVKYNTIKYLYEMATAKYWIDNTRKQPQIIKRKGQVYIHTWHGGVYLKKIEKDACDVLDKTYVSTAINDSKNIDYLLTNSEWGKKNLEQCFWYNGPILKTGSARNDILFQGNKNVSKIKKEMQIDEDSKVILYAPTFRKNKNTNVYNLDYKGLKAALEHKFGGKWTILIKLHPNIKESYLNIPDFVKNVSYHSDINELYLISDVLITDYSSTIFDFSITMKPAFIFALDYDDYMKDRNTYFDIKNMAFNYSESNEELFNNIKLFNLDEYEKKLKAFHKSLGLVEDGKACERIAKLIESNHDNNKL